MCCVHFAHAQVNYAALAVTSVFGPSRPLRVVCLVSQELSIRFAPTISKSSRSMGNSFILACTKMTKTKKIGKQIMLWSCLGLLLSPFLALKVYILVTLPWTSHGFIENVKFQVAHTNVLTADLKLHEKMSVERAFLFSKFLWDYYQNPR